jgi:hypothetical protein
MIGPGLSDVGFRHEDWCPVLNSPTERRRLDAAVAAATVLERGA